jgi:glyoxylase-like metal-dependent hydrolase (beta-lactamase superfamily II)
MIEIAPDVFYIHGQNKSRFPYCACLYVKGKDTRVLIDAGMGHQNIAPAKKLGIDLLILTHCHIDHRLTRPAIIDVPVWCHASEDSFLKNNDLFFTAMGLKRSGLDFARHFNFDPGTFDITPTHRLVDGERIELGGLTLETIHTPGHTPGHLAFFIPERNLLFTGDIDLTSFGPFYGHDFADIGDFVLSIDKLKLFDAKIAVSGHAGPFNGDLAARFEQYKQVIFNRDHVLLETLVRPKSLDDFKGANLFYKYYPDYPDLIKWFEMVHIEKHLSRLADLGKVHEDSGKWIRG